MSHDCYNNIKIGDEVTISDKRFGIDISARYLVVGTGPAYPSGFNILCLSHTHIDYRITARGSEWGIAHCNINTTLKDKYMFRISDSKTITTIRKK